jgi:hypothetical protein
MSGTCRVFRVARSSLVDCDWRWANHGRIVVIQAECREVRRPSFSSARQAIRVRHYSRRTEYAYVAWIRRFIVFFVELNR